MRARAGDAAGWWWAGALASVAGGLLLALRSGTRSWFQYDDFFNFGLAQRKGLTWDYLSEPFFEHFEPGHRALSWGLDRWFPMDWTAALVIQCGFLVVGGLCLFGLLRRLSRPSPWHLVLVLTYVAALANDSALAWWSAGAQNLSSSAGTIACLLLFVVHVQTRSLWALAGSALAFVAALSFYEKPILVPLYLVLLLLLVIEPPGSARDAGRALLREWRAWALFGAVTVAYLIYYRASGYGSQQPVAALGELWTYAKIAWLRGYAPSVLGVVIDDPATHAQELAIVAAQATMLLLVAWTVSRRPAVALRAWTFFGIAFIVNLVIVGTSRVEQFGPGIAFEPRYWTEYVIAFAIAAGVALCGRFDGEGERPLMSLPAWAGRSAWAWIGSGAAAAVFVACVAHGATVVREMGPPEAVEAIVKRVNADVAALRQAGVRPVIQDGPVPSDAIQGAWLAPYNRWWYVAPVLHLDATVASPATPQFVVSPKGALIPQRWSPLGAPLGRKALGAAFVAARVSTRNGLLCATGTGEASAIEVRWPRPVRTPRNQALRMRFTAVAPRAVSLSSFADGGAGYGPNFLPIVPLDAGRSSVVLELLPQPVGLRLGIPVGATVCPERLELGTTRASGVAPTN